MRAPALTGVFVVASVLAGCGDPAPDTAQTRDSVSDPAPLEPTDSEPETPPLPEVPVAHFPSDAELRALGFDGLLRLLDSESAFHQIVAAKEVRRRVHAAPPDPAWLPELIARLRVWIYEPLGRRSLNKADVFAPFGASAVPALGAAMADTERPEAERDVAESVLHLVASRETTGPAVRSLGLELARTPATAAQGLELLIWGDEESLPALRVAVDEGCFTSTDFRKALGGREYGLEERWLLELVGSLEARGDLASALYCVLASGADASDHLDLFRRAFADDDVETHRLAAAGVAHLGAFASLFIGDVLASDDREVHEAFAYGLGRSEAAMTATWTELITALGDGSDIGLVPALWFAARRHGRLDELARVAGPHIGAWLGGDDDDACGRALRILQYDLLDPTAHVGRLGELLALHDGDEDESISWTAATVLARAADVGSVSDALQRYVEGASNRTLGSLLRLDWADDRVPPRLLAEARTRVERGGEEPLPASALRRLLETESVTAEALLERADAQAEWAAPVAQAIAEAKATLPGLRALHFRRWSRLDADGRQHAELPDADRARILHLLSEQNGWRPDDVAQLLEWLQHPAPEVRFAASRGLVQLAPEIDDHPLVVRHLMALFARGESVDLVTVARALPTFGEAAHTALPELARVAVEVNGVSGALACFGDLGFAAFRALPPTESESRRKSNLGSLRRQASFAFKLQWYELESHAAEVGAFCRAALVAEYGPPPAGSDLPADIPDWSVKYESWAIERVRAIE